MLDFLHTMRGPEFLVVFAGWFVVCFGGLLVLRISGRDTPSVSFTAFALFEGLAVMRIVVGSWYGMQRWGFLIVAMLAGGVCFFFRAEHFKNLGGGGGGGWTSCSGGSSCSSGGGSSCSGGGGCGGGSGCGGCGGS